MKKKAILLLAALSGVVHEAAAQKKTENKTQIITFETKDYSGKSESDNPGKNSLTIGVLSWFNGYIPVHYERRLTNFLSVQVGGGITMRSYGNDFGQLVHEDGRESNFFNSGNSALTDVTDKYESYLYRKTRPGYYLSVSPRVYFSDNVMDGFTLAPMLEYKQFRYAAQLADVKATDASAYEEGDVPRVSEIFGESMKCLDFTMNVGGHYQSDNHMVLAWNVGFGIRNLDAKRLDLGYSSDMGATRYINAVHAYSKVRPLLTFDLRIGGWF